MKKILILVFIFNFSIIFSQEQEEIDRLQKQFDTQVTNLENQYQIDLKNLGKEDYIYNKKKLQDKLTSDIYNLRKIKQEKTSDLKSIIKQKEEDAYRLERQEEERRKRDEDKKIREKNAIIAAFKNSSRGQLYKKIKSSYISWKDRGEFETQFDYDKRMNDSLNAFSKITDTIIKESKERYLNGGCETFLDNYSIDEQLFKIKTLCQNYSLNTDIIELKVNPDIAIILKERFGINGEIDDDERYDNRGNRKKTMTTVITDVTMKDNEWIPNQAILIFPNKSSIASPSYLYIPDIQFQSNKVFVNYYKYGEEKKETALPFDNILKSGIDSSKNYFILGVYQKVLSLIK